MRKIYLFFVFTFTSLTLFSQQVPRQMVILEIGTGTWCQFCPGASMGASDLLSNGHNVGVIKYHSGDSFTNTASSARLSYYGISSYPTSKFDGVLTHSGGSTNQSIYPAYLPLFNQRAAIPSSFFVEIAGTSTDNEYNIQVTLTKVAAYTGTNIVAHLALTESNIPFSWQGQTHINQAMRLMAPNQNGTALDFTNTDEITLNLSFTVDPTWIYDLELVAFIQDNTTKEILQGNKVMLEDLQPPFFVDFVADQTEFCPPDQVQFTDLSEDAATFWEWSFPGGTPSASSLQNPVVTYSTPGTYNVALTSGDGDVQNTTSKASYITVLSVPASLALPDGPSNLCSDPGSITYTTAPVYNADSYEWILEPSAAGTLIPNGTQCVVAWDPGFIGNAQLNARGINDCGVGYWSPTKNITISIQPSQAGTPTGPETLCQNPGSVEYSSSGANDITDFLWELFPASAGTIIPMWTVCYVDWNPDFTGTAMLTITGINNGCHGEPSEAIDILVNSYPADFTMTGGGILCENVPGLEIGLAGSESDTDYTLYLDGVSTGQSVAGTGSSINFGLHDEEGVYTVLAINTTDCEVMLNDQVEITTMEIPGVAAQPDGPISVFTPDTPTSEYTTTGALHATAYEWEFVPDGIGSTTAVGPQVTISWSETFQGEVLIRVRGVNFCGEGEFSEELLVMVDNGVGIGTPSLKSLLSIYPNPATGIVTVDPVFGGEYELRIADLTGRLVYNERFSGSAPVQLNLEHLNDGVYLVTLIADQQTQTRRLIMK